MKVRALLASVLFLFILFLGACSKKGINESGGASTTTGWEYNNTENGGFEVVQKYEPETGPGLVFVEGGSFTMGRVEQDLNYDWNNVPRRVTVSPAVYADFQNKAMRLVYGSYISYSTVFAGLWMKHEIENIGNSAIGLHLGYSFSYVRLCYSFDYLFLSSSGLSHSGIHEVSLSFRFPHEAKRKKIEAIKCPKI